MVDSNPAGAAFIWSITAALESLSRPRTRRGPISGSRSCHFRFPAARPPTRASSTPTPRLGGFSIRRHARIGELDPGGAGRPPASRTSSPGFPPVPSDGGRPERCDRPPLLHMPTTSLFPRLMPLSTIRAASPPDAMSLDAHDVPDDPATPTPAAATGAPASRRNEHRYRRLPPSVKRPSRFTDRIEAGVAGGHLASTDRDAGPPEASSTSTCHARLSHYEALGDQARATRTKIRQGPRAAVGDLCGAEAWQGSAACRSSMTSPDCGADRQMPAASAFGADLCFRDPRRDVPLDPSSRFRRLRAADVLEHVARRPPVRASTTPRDTDVKSASPTREPPAVLSSPPCWRGCS